jgi:hypothetical protein
VIDITVIVGEHGDGSIDTLMVLSYTRQSAGTAEWTHVQVVHYGVGSEMRFRRPRSLTNVTWGAGFVWSSNQYGEFSFAPATRSVALGDFILPEPASRTAGV